MGEPAPAGDGPGSAVGLVYEHFGEREVRATAPVTPAAQQPFGIVHGGVFSVIAESMASVGTYRAVAGDGNVAMGMSNVATFLRPIGEGTIHASATALHTGRTTWVWDVEFTDDAERLCATVRVTIAVRPMPKPPGG